MHAERPRSQRSVFCSSPPGMSTPVSIAATPQGIRRTLATPTSAVDAELLGFAAHKTDSRLSPHHRTPTLEAGTPRLAAAVAEAKRVGAAAPTPSQSGGGDTPMDQFDRLLARDLRGAGAYPQPSPTAASTSAGPAPLPSREEVSSPNVAWAVHTAVADEGRRRELLLGLHKLFQDVKAAGSAVAPPGPQRPDAVTDSIARLVRAARDVSPPQRGAAPPAHVDAHVPLTFTQRPTQVRPLCRPQPSDAGEAKLSVLAQELAKRAQPSKQRLIKSEVSAFSETEESSSLTSYSTARSANKAGARSIK